MDAWTTVVIEDQTLFRELLVRMLRGDARYRLLGEACDGIAGLALCRTTRPHLIVLDLQLPGMDGFQLSQKLFSELPEARILALTSCNDDHTLVRILETGFAGYVEKDQPYTVLEEALLEIAGGGTYFSPGFEEARRRMARDPEAFCKILSRRERQVLKLVAAGRSNPEVARRLKLSPRTIGNHRQNIMKKLGVHNVTDLTAFAIKNGFRLL